MNARVVAIASAVTVVAMARAVSADTAPGISIQFYAGDASASYASSNGTYVGGQLWNYDGMLAAGGSKMTFSETVDPDPSLGFSYEFFNNTGSTQTFTVIATLPVVPWNNGTLMGCSLGGSVTDANFDGVASLSAVPGGSLFTGYIDSVSQVTVFSDPFSVSVPFSGGTSTIGPGTAGLPGPSIPGPASITTDISIKLTFNLTAGDRASFTGIWVVALVPAPGAAALLTVAGLFGVRRRRVAG